MVSWLHWLQLPDCFLLLLHRFRHFPPLPPYLQIVLWNNKNNAIIRAVGSFVWHSFGQEDAVSSNISGDVYSVCLFKDKFAQSTQTLQPPNSRPARQHFFKASRPFCTTVCSSLPSERKSVTHGIDRFHCVACAVKSAHITIIGCGSLQLLIWIDLSFSEQLPTNPVACPSSGIQQQWRMVDNGATLLARHDSAAILSWIHGWGTFLICNDLVLTQGHRCGFCGRLLFEIWCDWLYKNSSTTGNPWVTARYVNFAPAIDCQGFGKWERGHNTQTRIPSPQSCMDAIESTRRRSSGPSLDNFYLECALVY